MAHQRLFHLGRRDIFAGPLDHFLLPAKEIEVAFGVLAPQVSGVEPAALEQRPGGLRVLEVAQGQRAPGLAAHHDLADLAHAHGLVVVVHNEHLAVGRRSADRRIGGWRRVRLQRDVEHGFGLAVAVAQRNPEALDERLDLGLGNVDGVAGEPHLVRGVVRRNRLIQQRAAQHAGQAADRDPMLDKLAQVARRTVAFADHRGGARRQARQHGLLAVGVKQRLVVEHAVRPGQPTVGRAGLAAP
ncbi:hypothetical protein D3C72_1299970 [compost metagenome]